MDELFFTGYCRCLDSSRVVTAETEQGKLTEVDCNFPSCPYAPNCSIGKELETYTQSGKD